MNTRRNSELPFIDGGERLRSLGAKHGLNVRDVASITGVSMNTARKWWRGRKRLPDFRASVLLGHLKEDSAAL